MSDVWRSTPRYHCKFCNTFVRDTKLDKQQHEATGRHQGAVQRSIRTLHKDNEREKREKQKVKDEVARLNRIVSGAGVVASGAGLGPARSSGPTTVRQASEAERKKQVAQLADMGVAVPDGFRREMALAGEWETVAERPMKNGPSLKQERDVKPDVHALDAAHSRKRDRDDGVDEDEEEGGEKGWGTKFKIYKSAEKATDSDIEALFKGGASNASQNTASKWNETTSNTLVKPEPDDASDVPIKNEDDESPPQHKPQNTTSLTTDAEVPVKQEEGAEHPPSVVFKKRKAKVPKP